MCKHWVQFERKGSWGEMSPYLCDLAVRWVEGAFLETRLHQYPPLYSFQKAKYFAFDPQTPHPQTKRLKILSGQLKTEILMNLQLQSDPMTLLSSVCNLKVQCQEVIGLTTSAQVDRFSSLSVWALSLMSSPQGSPMVPDMRCICL